MTRRRDEHLDGGAMDPKLARILLRYREAVAQATERAYRELEWAGFRGMDLRDQRRSEDRE